MPNVTKESIEELQAVLGKLKTASDLTFANSLIAGYHKYGDLTPKQAPFIGKLIARANEPAPQMVPSDSLGDFTKVVELFNKAKVNLKYPKVKLSCEGKTITLSLCGVKSKTPGYINVAGEGSYPNQEWFGRISPNGDWFSGKSWSSDTFRASLKALLKEFGDDPHGIAAQYGKLTGACCFCNLPLSDKRSVVVGYGPVCAKNYGMKELWNAAAKGVAADEPDKETEATQGSLLDSLEEELANKLKEAHVIKKIGVVHDAALYEAEDTPCYMCGGKASNIVLNGFRFCDPCATEMTGGTASA
jgi:hypothetical protein